MNRRQFLVGAAGVAAFPRLALEPARAVALATADLESRVVAVDLRSGRVLGHIATRAFPRSIERVGSSSAVVCHSELGLVSVLDVPSLAVRHVVGGFGEPRYVAAHPDGRHAYVTDARRGDVALLDTRSGRVLAREPVGPLARHISLDRVARRLWVALGSKAREVAVVDVSSLRPRLVRRFAPPFLAHDVGFAPDRRHGWVTGGEGRSLAVYDLGSGRVVATPAAGWPPQHVTFDSDRAYVTSGWSGSLQVHALGGRQLLANPVPVGSYNVQQDEGWVVTPALGRGYLTTVGLDGTPLRSERIARSSHDACIVRHRSVT
jgi:DNA-binding beta-propeller fold protein YncE